MKHTPKLFATFLRETTAIVVALAVGSTAFAQITITNATFPGAGDTLRMAIDNSSSGVLQAVFTPPGGPQTWDLSGLQVDATQVFIYRAASEGSVAAQVPGAALVAAPSPNAEEYYNVPGKKLRTLVNGMQPAGRHTLVWDAQDDSGTQVTSGIYFVRMYAKGKGKPMVMTHKMMLLK